MANENSVKTKQFLVAVPVRNPVQVRNDAGALIGSAVVSFVPEGLMVEFNLDRNTPEAFDLEVNPDRVKKEVSGILDSEGLDLFVIIHT